MKKKMEFQLTKKKNYLFTKKKQIKNLFIYIEHSPHKQLILSMLLTI